ncbi:MAG: ATP-grasp domain-containing protein [Planctomycetia bacterium]|nr:ATP-grasp domain-containing protein [Planctomycetia bacterium]
MRVFIYEYMTGSGTGRESDSPEHSLYIEGRAMRDAIAADFRLIPNTEVFIFADKEAPVDHYTFNDAANNADWTLIIAPESEDKLLSLAEEVWPTGSRFLGPSSDTLRLTSDKLALAEHWYDRDVPTPFTTDREPSTRAAFPIVWKPQDGAGSTVTFLLKSAQDVSDAKEQLEAEDHTGPMIVQQFVPGRAASVAFLCGPAGQFPLPPTFQFLSEDRFKYLGGEVPIPSELAERAVKLARRAIESVPGLLGYVGVDLVLGSAEDGSRDFAIEINPRLTTSYVGLRALADFNIAELMLKVAKGESPGELKWKPGKVRFNPDGTATSVADSAPTTA